MATNTGALASKPRDEDATDILPALFNPHPEFLDTLFMDRFLEYLNHHPYLAGGTLLLALVTAAWELYSRAQNATGISNNETIALHNRGALLLDARSAEEFAAGHIVNARNITLESLSDSLDSIKKYREKPVIVYCETGSRSAQAVKLLKAQGYTTVFNLSGGLAGWRTENLPLNKNSGDSKSAKKA
jgi:rhodanese-related sulfurtransferase